MKILVIGSGGREHALVWKLRKSPSVTKLWCAPGNGGIAQDAECVAADLADITGLGDLAARLGADLTVVGPEGPLVLGIADEFARRGLRVLAPSKEGAQLEGSKIFAKRFLERHNVATPGVLGVFDSPDEACSYLRSAKWPVVLKADGLCSGKGVLVARSFDEAKSFIYRLMKDLEFGAGGARLLIEEAVAGKELSFIVLTDGKHSIPLVPTRDHKRVFDNDRGPNTGGMGAYSSDDLIPPDLHRTIVETIVRPTLRGLAADGCEYRGFLYFGLMLTDSGPKVLEFNCRLGDPETQAIVVRMDFDLAQALDATVSQTLDQVHIKWLPGASVCVAMTSGGYPGSYEAGKPISGLAEASGAGASVFHAGTSTENGIYYTRSGRVLGVTASGGNLEAARQIAYEAVRRIRFDGAHFRSDIGGPAIGTKAAGD